MVRAGSLWILSLCVVATEAQKYAGWEDDDLLLGGDFEPSAPKPWAIEKRFTDIDANKDDKLSVKEMLAYYPSRQKAKADAKAYGYLRYVDSDKDGKISEAEFNADDMLKQMSETFTSCDSNGDKLLAGEDELRCLGDPHFGGKAEHQHDAMFGALDVNKDGFVEFHEWNGEAGDHNKPWKAHSGEDLKMDSGEFRKFRSTMMAVLPDEEDMKHLAEKFDTDKDGQLSRNEYTENHSELLREQFANIFTFTTKELGLHEFWDALDAKYEKTQGDM